MIRAAFIRDWGLAAVSVGCVVAASWFALTRKDHAARAIHRLGSVGTALTEVAQQTGNTLRSPAEAADLEAQRKELQTRIMECGLPHLVAAGISELTRRVGANVLEIKPVQEPMGARAAVPSAVPVFPRFRVSVTGTYAQIGEFMTQCPHERLPVRIVEFALAPWTVGGGVAQGLLRADITVESYQRRPTAGGAQTRA